MPFQSHPNFGFPLSDFFHSTEEPNSCVLHHNNQQNSDTAWTLHSVVPVWMHSSIQSAAHQWFMLFVCCCSHIGHSLAHKQFILSPVFQHSSRDHTAAMEANKQTCCCTPLFVEMFLFFLGEMNKKHIHVSHCSHVSQHEGHKESLQQHKTTWTNWSGMTSFVSFLWQHKTVICSSICNAAERINRRVGCLSKQEEKMNSNWTTWQCIQAVPGPPPQFCALNPWILFHVLDRDQTKQPPKFLAWAEAINPNKQKLERLAAVPNIVGSTSQDTFPLIMIRSLSIPCHPETVVFAPLCSLVVCSVEDCFPRLNTAAMVLFLILWCTSLQIAWQ